MTAPGLVFKVVLISTLGFALIFLSVNGAPANLQNEKNCTQPNGSNVEDNNFDEIIDQSQNGSENYRVTIKDILVVFAPINSLLAATALLDTPNLGEELLNLDLSQLNKPHEEENHPLVVDLMENKPSISNSSEIISSSNETEKPELGSTAKPASTERSGEANYPAIMGPFLSRKL